MCDGQVIQETHEDVNAMYIREMQHFYDVIQGLDKPKNTIDSALTTMRIAEES